MNEPNQDSLGSRSLSSAVLWRGAYLLLQGGLSVLLFACLAQALSEPEFASVAVALGFVVLVQALGDFGLSGAVVTALPSSMAIVGAADRRRLLGAAAKCFWVAAGIALIACLASSTVTSADAQSAVILIAPAAGLAVLVSGADGLLRAQGEFARPVALVSASRLGSFAGLLGSFSDSAALTAGLISIGTMLGSVPAIRVMLHARRGGGRSDMASFARSAIPLGVSQLLVVASGRGNTVVLSAVSGVRAGAVFEGAWRLFQLSQYAVGAISTGVSPILASQAGARDFESLRRAVSRLLPLVGVVGVLIGGVLWAIREPVSTALAATLGTDVSGAVVPLLLATPIAFLGFFATFVLAARPAGRRKLVPAYGVGALVNAGLLMSAMPHPDARSAATSAAAGLSTTSVLLLVAMAGMVWAAPAPAIGPAAAVETAPTSQR